MTDLVVSPMSSTAMARTRMAAGSGSGSSGGGGGGAPGLSSTYSSNALPPLPPSLSPSYGSAQNVLVSTPPPMPPQPSFPELGIGGYEVRGNVSPRVREKQLRLLKKKRQKPRRRKPSPFNRSNGLHQRHREFTQTARILLQDVQQRRDGNFMF